MRTCIVCGKKLTAGMTDNEGDFYAHEGKCFNKYMDEVYGKHKWMEIGKGCEDEYGGYYLAADNNCSGYTGTGIFWTEWEDDEEE